ncbi:MAG TPA: sigma factor-like helix-turn-helix DNA-binding protein [bacterium]|nr:sigma factor-like helix-turn-helix DNA-binding protein [bacterium]
MKNETILNEIISEGQVNEVASLNLAEIISHLLANLNPREQDVLRRRYGLAGSEKETLESIGRAHKLTRERIRQIENVSVNKIKKNQSSEKLLSKLQKTVGDLLSEHGGVIDKAYLFKILHQLAKLQNVNSESAEYYNHLSFLTSRIINDNLEELNDQELFNDLLKLKEQGIEHLAEVATEALNKISEAKLMVATDDLIDLILKSSAYQKHADKFQAPGNLDFSNQMKEALPDYSDKVWGNRVVYGLIKSIKKLDQNKFGNWGHTAWREVLPKTVNDKIYLVLKNHGKPMYYGDIAKRITELGFDAKNVNTATTHNELILDDKYVLVGRGMYGLKEWGYQDGTVADVVEAVLKAAARPMAKDELTEAVMKQRLVKQTTVNLALMNKNRFAKNSEGKYIIAVKKS